MAYQMKKLFLTGIAALFLATGARFAVKKVAGMRPPQTACLLAPGPSLTMMGRGRALRRQGANLSGATKAPETAICKRQLAPAKNESGPARVVKSRRAELRGGRICAPRPGVGCGTGPEHQAHETPAGDLIDVVLLAVGGHESSSSLRRLLSI